MDALLAQLPPGFSAWDLVAVTLVLVAIHAVTWVIEAGPHAPRSMSAAMQRHRLGWMLQMIRRENRMFDAALLGIIRQGAAFYASAAMIAIGALAALVGRAEAVQTLASDLLIAEAGRRFWEIKLLFPLGLMVLAFLKFAWAHRLFGYCAVMMGAIAPLESGDGEAAAREDLARRAGHVNISAARSFNRGLRAVYFALASLAWAFGPWALIAATALVIYMLMRREFVSKATRAVAGPPPEPGQE